MTEKMVGGINTKEELDKTIKELECARNWKTQLINQVKVIISAYGCNKSFKSFDGNINNGKYEYCRDILGLDIRLATYVINNETAYSLTVREGNRVVCDTMEDLIKAGEWRDKIIELYYNGYAIIKSMNSQKQLLDEGLRFFKDNAWYIDQALQCAPECTEYVKDYLAENNPKFIAYSLDDKLIIVESTEPRANSVNGRYESFDVNSLKIYDLSSNGELVFKCNTNMCRDTLPGVSFIEVYKPGEWKEYIFEYYKKCTDLEQGSKTNKRSGK